MMSLNDVGKILSMLSMFSCPASNQTYTIYLFKILKVYFLFIKKLQDNLENSRQ